MPNWCENELTITGKDVDKLNKFFGNNFCFSKIIPYPQAFKKLDQRAEEYNKNKKPDEEYMKDGFNTGGYEWRVKHWGTKWDINQEDLAISECDKEIIFEFDTAWSPPTPVIIRLAEMFPTLRFEMRSFERGMEFSCILICENGKLTKQKTVEYFGNRGG